MSASGCPERPRARTAATHTLAEQPACPQGRITAPHVPPPSPRLQARSGAFGAAEFDHDFAGLPAAAEAPGRCAEATPEAVWHAFLTMPTPFRKEFWVLRAGNAPVGRVGANLSPSRPGTGYVGFLEVVPGPRAAHHAAALLHAASAWLRQHGASRAYGPVNFSTWFDYRLRLDDDVTVSGAHKAPPSPFPFGGKPARAWEPGAPPQVATYFVAAGYTECMRFHSMGLTGLRALSDSLRASFEACEARGYRFECLGGAELAHRIPALYDLSMRGFAANYLFEPLDEQAFRLFYAPEAAKRAGVFASMAYGPTGEPAGFFLAFADGEELILKSTTVVPEHRGLGLSNALLHLTCAVGADAGLQHPVTALVRSGARSECYARRSNARWTHHYALFERTLAGHAD